jgi:serine/threonine-protein kinase
MTLTKAGRYEIVGELGRGAMGVVYKATDPVIGRTVAVKTIRLSEEGTGLTRPELLARFQTEARAAGLLTHPNIVVIFDAGEEDGLYYITMELVEGKSLQALLDGGQAFPLPRVMRIMEQICGALQFAHERRVVHRDIKPANIMLAADDTVKITDFGTAKILQFGTVQQTTHVMGTPSYMSPEQVKGRAVDGRSDIFSLGVMLYEMATGEKPFPGQNITTVIYKIVNEDPVPPREVDPSIHSGINAVIMKALAKDPDTRYQTCREMLEDLRNYRALVNAGGSPDVTVVGGTPNATVAFAGASGRGMSSDDTATIATTRALTSRASGPGQTPAIRRTGIIPPYEEPKKNSILPTVLVALSLMGVIAYGAYKLRPVYEDVRQQRASGPATQESSSSTAANSSTESSGAPAQTNDDKAKPQNSTGAASSSESETKSLAPVEKPTPKKIEPATNPTAAAFKEKIDGELQNRSLAGRVKVSIAASTLILSGKLRPAEHAALLKFLRDAPNDVHIVDHIEYEDSPIAPDANSGANSGDGAHPAPAAGRSAVHVVTDVIGARAILHGPAGRVLNECQTPCSFNDLFPTRYSLEVQKDGYQPIQTALQLKAGEVSDQKFALESLAKGLLITTQPAGADVFINGAKQSGQTPVTLPLAPGQYNLVLRMPGYEAYAGNVQVSENAQTRLDIKMNEKSQTKVAFAQISSAPAGAEIWVDGASTGQVTPARVQMPTGVHMVTLKLSGYQPVRRAVQASEGGTVTLDETLHTK